MPNGDEHWNNQEWFRHIVGKLDDIRDKLGEKTDTTTTERLEDRLERVERRTSYQEAKTTGIASVVTMAGIWVKSIFS